MSWRMLLGGLFMVASILVLQTLSLKDGGERAGTLNMNTNGIALETATFGAGCFWHVEDSFREVEGVITTAVGFQGGTMPQPTYRDVCSNQTGHAEVVQVRYDPARVSYAQLLEKFFALHDPTSLDRQGPDVGTQYRSVIFYHTPEQKKEAEEFKSRVGQSGRFSSPVVTEIAAASTFWKAEEYHQQYYEKQRR